VFAERRGVGELFRVCIKGDALVYSCFWLSTMEALYAQAAYCTQGEERARGLVESVRLHAVADAAVESNRWVQMATSLAEKTVFELETQAVEVDARIEDGDLTEEEESLFVCQPLVTLEALEANFTILTASEGDKWARLEEAVEKGNAILVDLLIQGGVDPSARGNWAVRLASHKGHLPVVERLLADARVDPSSHRNYAVQCASIGGYLSVVDRLLQDERVDPSDRDNRAIKQASSNGHLSVVERLLQDARVDPASFSNMAIELASSGGHLSVVERLLQDERVDPSANDNMAIQGAFGNGHRHVVGRLLRDKRVVDSLPPGISYDYRNNS